MASPAPEILEVTQLPRLPPRPADSNKGTFGRVLVVAGARGMAGAAILCGSAALRGGAGLVYVAVPSTILPIVAAANPCYLTIDLPDDGTGQLRDPVPAVHAQLKDKTVLALGPGLGQGAAIGILALRMLESCPLPLVLDADGLNALQGRLGAHTRPLAGPRILTPHPGEFGRLLGMTAAQVQATRQELAVRFAGDHGVILVLKGHGTIVTDGRRVYRNTTGNPGMATGGTGDVLTGLIAALLGQGLEPFAAAQLGVYWHGLAGDLARDELGEVSLIASDLLDYVPRAMRR